jgi:hypothetical protein
LESPGPALRLRHISPHRIPPTPPRGPVGVRNFGEFSHAPWSLGAQVRVFLANSGSHFSGDVARHVVWGLRWPGDRFLIDVEVFLGVSRDICV